MFFKKSWGTVVEESLSHEERQTKISEVRRLLGPIADKLQGFCSDAVISRYLRVTNWNTKNAYKMLNETLKWRLDYRPEMIRWDDIAHEAETGKIYRPNYLDKYGRSVLVMRPGFQNTHSTLGQIRYLVYCIENAIMNLAPDQEQMVWLIGFQGLNMASLSLKVSLETIHVLQQYYPEQLGVAILYDPPKIFESFYTMVKPFLNSKTHKKVKFVYSNNPESQTIMEDLFDKEKLEYALGGKNSVGFDYKEYSGRMKEDDKKMSDFIQSGYSTCRHQLSDLSLGQSKASASSHSLEEASSDHEDYDTPNLTDTDNPACEKMPPGQPGCKDSAKGVVVAEKEKDVIQKK